MAALAFPDRTLAGLPIDDFATGDASRMVTSQMTVSG
jgi:hypothetical protein